MVAGVPYGTIIIVGYVGGRYYLLVHTARMYMLCCTYVHILFGKKHQRHRHPLAASNAAKMKFYASLLLAAIHTAALVEADAFISAASPATIASRGQGYVKANAPLTKAGSSSHHRGVAMASALKMSGGGGGGDVLSTEGTATIPDEVFNLVKSIVGAGVLSLPAGEDPHH